MAKWMVAAKRADFEQIAKKYQITPVLARLLRNREINSDEEAAGIICGKIRQGKKIRVIGDYDVDGICSSYLLKRGY